MKSLFIKVTFLLILFLLILPSFSANAEQSQSCNEQYNSLYRPVRKYFEAWNQQDPEQLLATFTSDGVYEEANGGFSLKQQAEAKQFLEKTFNSSPDARFTLLNLLTDGKDTVAAHWNLVGTFQGKPYAVQGVDILHLEAGKIKSARGFSNSSAE